MLVDATNDGANFQWVLSGLAAIQLTLLGVVYKVLSRQVSRLEDSKLVEIWTAIDALRKTDAEMSEKILDRLSNIPTREEVRGMLRDMLNAKGS